MTDNVNVFERIIFSIPPVKKTVSIVLLSSILYVALIFGLTGLFSADTVDIPTISGIVITLMVITLLAGELSYRILKNYSRSWGYFLSASNLFILYVYGSIITLSNTFAMGWNIMWLGLVTIFVSNVIALLLSLSYTQIRRIVLFSLIQPLSILSMFHLLLGRQLGIPLAPYLLNIFVLFVAGILILLSLGLMEYLLRANTSGISMLSLTSGLLQKSQQALDLGYEAQPEVQTLEIGDEFKALVPWVHPGPLEGFGGGKLSNHIIEKLNQEGEGFFLHVPSTHKSDPADPRGTKKILDSMEEPVKSRKASKMVEKDYKEIKLYGRRLGDGKKIIYLDAREFGKYDDFDVSIFKETLDLDKSMIIDLHSHDRNHTDVEECWYGTEDAEYLRSCIRDFTELLDSEETLDYSAGVSVDTNDTPLMTLVEKVDGQKTLIIGVEDNGISKEIRSIADSMRKDFDKVVCLSTDTHVSIHEMSADKKVDVDRVLKNIEEASKSLSGSSIGFSTCKADSMKLLKEDYLGLVFSINILLRLLPLTLLLIYVGLVIWIV